MTTPLKRMQSNEIRQSFIDFFQDRDHSLVRGTSLIPRDDPTLLFTNAGMNQFKNIFLGRQKPRYPRVVNSQKCIRVSGKHNDLEEVGLDDYHHTFFEMLGNWSFGDYYKEEAIRWAWELLTEVWGLPKDRLWATVYTDDDEAEDLWKKATDIDPARVLKFGKQENFWEMGDVGPCGPSSEVHYYVGKDLSRQSLKGVNTSDEYWELWNLVFIQYNRDQDGRLEGLPQKHVDTGAGLERLTAVLQNKTSDYETDLFQPTIRDLESMAQSQFDRDPVAHRVISDHVRMLAFAIADGVMPSNEGRGYVLRRILRRAARFGHRLGLMDPFLHRLAKTVSDGMGDTYPELVERLKHIESVIEAEEKNFNATLDKGMDNFEKIVSSLSGSVIPGIAAFRLYDTYGFPVDLTEQMARERGLTVELEGFDQAMEEQRERTRSLARFTLDSSRGKWVELTKGSDSEFVGYTDLATDSVIRRYQVSQGKVLVILDKTPFYGEQGGQVGDTGVLEGDGFTIPVEDTVKDGPHHIHVGEFAEGVEISGEKVKARIDAHRRQKIRLNHTATHLLHKALKVVLGEHVQQAGSLVGPDYLRFDLTHYQKITRDEIREIERITNREIQNNTALDITVRDFDQARKDGAVAIFEEKYGDRVRVITIGDFSKELCGGTHVDRTGDIGFFKIIDESALAAGVRRLVAVTGPEAVRFVGEEFDSLSRLQEALNCSREEVMERVVSLLDEKKRLEKELKKRRSRDGTDQLARIVKQSRTVGKRRMVVTRVKADDLDHLKGIGDQVAQWLESGVGVLLSRIDSKPSLVCVVTRDLVKEGIRADKLAQSFGEKLGGGGGGKAHLATAGGKETGNVKTAMKDIQEDISALLGKLQEESSGK
ncbi:MAG: alanine--tRNA ligase [Fidelibacterota bacterium]